MNRGRLKRLITSKVAVDDSMRSDSLTAAIEDETEVRYPEPACNEGNRAKWKQIDSITLTLLVV